MPRPPISRKQVDDVGRVAVEAIAGSARAIAGLARSSGGALKHMGSAIRDVPPALRLLSFFGIAAMLGVVGSISLAGTAGLICSVVVIPVCSIAVGALGHRWYYGQGHDSPRRSIAPQSDTDLTRSVAYIDKKLTLALNTFGSERHQQGVIALFQAKTAAELALGTDQDSPSSAGDPALADEYRLRPRIQAGSASLAAS
ncbi:hypothetical protein JRC04_18320 [Mycolicibacterium sp. S2-37]|uniref:hypothetical protein n=1 Tax=Mycolicibacterium sp. S2-37 TaxID=2810297 RepID=UPI001A9488BA|nr:hypothetical protein [Mycolicibacterium sp. S2-37]MBO0679421.1 hypothetical protein [Mycolicibacterium sp. S2-37]